MLSKFERTHRKIIKTGMELMKEHGFDGITISQICKAIGIARPTFYSHFNSKEKLIAEYYDYAYLFSSETQNWIFSAMTSWESILRLQLAYIANTSDSRHTDLISRYLTYQLTSKEEYFSTTSSEDLNEKAATILLTLIKKSQMAGEILNTSDPHYLSNAIMALQLGSLFSWCASKGNYNRTKAVFRDLEAILMVQPEYREIWNSYDYHVPGLETIF